MKLLNLPHSRTGWEKGLNVEECKDRTSQKQSSEVFLQTARRAFFKTSGGLTRVLGL